MSDGNTEQRENLFTYMNIITDLFEIYLEYW